MRFYLKLKQKSGNFLPESFYPLAGEGRSRLYIHITPNDEFCQIHRVFNFKNKRSLNKIQPRRFAYANGGVLSPVALLLV